MTREVPYAYCAHCGAWRPVNKERRIMRPHRQPRDPGDVIRHVSDEPYCPGSGQPGVMRRPQQEPRQ